MRPSRFGFPATPFDRELQEERFWSLHRPGPRRCTTPCLRPGEQAMHNRKWRASNGSGPSGSRLRLPAPTSCIPC